MVMLTDLADVLRAAGLTVIEEPGWKQRGHGEMTNVLGVTCHHTANGGAAGVEPSRGVVRSGRPGLAGPLAHLLLRTDGVYRVIAAGLCYHAGVSRSSGYTNSHRIGIEAEAKGVPGTPGDWPAAQMAAYHRGCKALAERFRFPVGQVLGHKETCAPVGRKSDPDFDMAQFRRDVAAVDLNANPHEEADVLADKDIEKIAEAVKDQPIDNLNADGTKGKSTIGGSIVDIERTQDQHTVTLRKHGELLQAILDRLPPAQQ